MDPSVAASPTLVGAFITAFLSLIGVVVWALRQQLSQSQKLIEVTIPAQQATFVTQMDKMAELFRLQMEKSSAAFQSEAQANRDFFQRQLEGVQRTFLSAHKEIVAWVKANQEALAANQKVLEQHSDILERHTALLETMRMQWSPSVPPTTPR